MFVSVNFVPKRSRPAVMQTFHDHLPPIATVFHEQHKLVVSDGSCSHEQEIGVVKLRMGQMNVIDCTCTCKFTGEFSFAIT
jgi:hypothetical protein